MSKRTDKADAERYRFLRERFEGSTNSFTGKTTWKCDFDCDTSHCIDAAIDAALHNGREGDGT